MFASQLSEVSGIEEIRNSMTGKIIGNVSGEATGVTGQVLKSPPPGVKNDYFDWFWLIFKNNLLVSLSAIILSIFYGVGGIFLIAWNASILAVSIVQDVVLSIGTTVGQGILTPLYIIFNSVVNAIGYIPHGLPEVLAYFIISVASAMLACNILKGVFTTEFRNVALKDLIYMFGLALLCLVIAALIEASYFI